MGCLQFFIGTFYSASAFLMQTWVYKFALQKVMVPFQSFDDFAVGELSYHPEMMAGNLRKSCLRFYIKIMGGALSSSRERHQMQKKLCPASKSP